MRQSQGNKTARRPFTASPSIRGPCGLRFFVLSQLLLKTGLPGRRRCADGALDSFPFRCEFDRRTQYTKLFLCGRPPAEAKSKAEESPPTGDFPAINTPYRIPTTASILPVAPSRR